MESCACCDSFVCDRMGSLLGGREGMLVFMHRRLGEVTEEEYNLCARQFESMPNLIKMLVKAGKLPGWAQ